MSIGSVHEDTGQEGNALMEAQAVALVASFWTSAADIMASVWPILAFPVGLAAVLALAYGVKGMFS